MDPSFLEALPEAIRREVLAEQLGLHPPPTQRNAAANENEGTADLNVSPEFLAALPPDVQEEVRELFEMTLLVQARIMHFRATCCDDILAGLLSDFRPFA